MAGALEQLKYSTKDDQSGSGATVTLDSTPTEDNLLVAMFMGAQDYDENCAISGWTEIEQAFNSTDWLGYACWYKVAGSSESATVTMTSNNEDAGAFIVWELTGMDIVSPTPLDDYVTDSSAPDTLTAGPIAIGSNACTYLGGCHFWDSSTNDQNFVWGDGFTEDADLMDASGGGSTELQVTFGRKHNVTLASTDATVTWDDSTGAGHMYLVAIREAETIDEVAGDSDGTSTATATISVTTPVIKELQGPQAEYPAQYGEEYPKAMPDSTGAVTGTLTNALLDNELAATPAGVGAISNASLTAGVEGFDELSASAAGGSSVAPNLNLIYQISSAFGGASSSNTAALSVVEEASSFRVSLTNPTAPGNQSLTHSLTVRARATTGTVYLTVKLWESTTLIHEFDTDTLTTSFAPFSSTLLQAEGESIGDYDDLEIEIVPHVSSTATIHVSEVDMWVPPAAVAGIGSYQTSTVGWDYTEYSILGLVPGATYDLGVRATDISGNTSSWASSVLSASGDTIAPSTPAAPTVAGSTMNIQVTHYLGVSTGGTFNLEDDLDHLNVYLGTTSGFIPDSGNKVGQISVTAGSLNLGIPAIGTFPAPTDSAPSNVGDPVETRWVRVKAVDRSGNESPQSDSASVTAELIDGIWISEASITDANINDLSATTITSGTIGAEVISLADSPSSRIQSNNGTDWYIRGDGYAKFTNVEVTGSTVSDSTITASTLTTATSGARVDISADTAGYVRLYSSTAYSGAIYGTSNDLLMSAVDQLQFLSGGVTTIASGGAVTIGGPSVTLQADTTDVVLIAYGTGDQVLLNVDAVTTGSDGTAAVPALSFVNDSNTGIYRPAANQIGFAAASELVMYMTADYLTNSDASHRPAIRFDADCSVSAPAYSFYGDTDTGMYRIADGYIGFAANGNIGFQVGPTADKYIYGLTTGAGSGTLNYNTGTNQITYDTSTRRIKKNITDLTDVGVTDRLRPRRFQMKTSHDLIDDYQGDLTANGSNLWRLGLIAEEVWDTLPDAALYGADDEVVNYEDRAVLAAVILDLQDTRQRLTILENA